MRRFKWTKSNAVFIPEIDNEHIVAFRMAGELEDTVMGGASIADLEPRLEALSRHIAAHFDHEERLMRDTRCPSYEWHQKMHAGARRRLASFLPEIRQGDAQAPHLLLEYLAEWLRDHLALPDRMMAAHLRNHERANARLAS